MGCDGCSLVGIVIVVIRYWGAVSAVRRGDAPWPVGIRSGCVEGTDARCVGHPLLMNVMARGCEQRLPRGAWPLADWRPVDWRLAHWRPIDWRWASGPRLAADVVVTFAEALQSSPAFDGRRRA
jgi:hypothetical protein